jgi:hypothetical protein
MRIALLVLVACAGCDKLFGVNHVDLRGDGLREDGETADADIPTCLGGDEDCDGLKNFEDFCPGDFDTKQDDDADGVGNACDPDTFGAEGNDIAFFDGFEDASGSWSIKSGPWQLGTGVFVQPQIADALVEKQVNLKYPWAEVVVPHLATSGNGSITIYGFAQGSDLRCKLTRRSSDGAEFLEISGLLIQPPKEVQLTGTGTLRLTGGQRQDGVFYCRARHGTNFDAEVANAMAGPVTIDKVGISTSSASVTISSVTLFKVP